MSLNSASWRRVASTHRLEDLLDGTDDDSDDTDVPPPSTKGVEVQATSSMSTTSKTALSRSKHRSRRRRRRRLLAVRLLGLACVALGTLGLLTTVFVASNCFPTTMRRIHDPIQCSSHLLSLWHWIYVEVGLHGVLIPVLASFGRLLKVGATSHGIDTGQSTGILFQLFRMQVDQAIAVLEAAYPSDEVAFWEVIRERGERPSEVALYSMAIPLVCVPVTFAMIAVNWFSMKLVRHN